MHCVRVSSARLAEYIKELKCAEGIVELCKHAGIFKNTREVQRSTSQSVHFSEHFTILDNHMLTALLQLKSI